MLGDPYASGVLNPDEHDRLVANIAAYAKDAGIAPRWIWTKMSEVCGPAELDYARKFPHHRIEGKVQGLVYFRKTPDADPETHMAALAGCLLRNFCRARVMQLGTVLDHLADGGSVAATCLLVPNFALSKATSRHGSLRPFVSFWRSGAARASSPSFMPRTRTPSARCTVSPRAARSSPTSSGLTYDLRQEIFASRDRQRGRCGAAS